MSDAKESEKKKRRTHARAYELTSDSRNWTFNSR